MTTSLAAGNDAIVASYSGDPNNSSSQGSLSGGQQVNVDNLWIGDSTGLTSVFTDTGVPYLTTALTPGGTGVAVDSSGDVWSLIAGSSSVAEFSNTGAVLNAADYTAEGGLSSPTSIAIDGSDNLWITNSNGSISEFNSIGTPVSPTTGYTGGAGGNLSTPTSIAIDISGNLWIANSGNNTVTEVLGAATPTVPLATGVASGTPASEP
jgi:ligand-binding sensor domain-containing protein